MAVRRTGQVAAARISPSPGRALSSGAAADGPASATIQPGSLKGLPRNEFIYCCFIFAITGSSAAYAVRPTLKWVLGQTYPGQAFSSLIGIQDPASASIFGGPWQFSLMYLCCMTPMYSLLLLTYGTIFGRGLFFRHFLVKMWSRMLPKGVHRKFEQLLIGGEKKA